MEDHRNHSFISNSSIRKFLFAFLAFSIPIVGIIAALEIGLRHIPLEPNIKRNYIEENSSKIKIAVFGSSQTERAINPAFLKYPTINFSNSSQRIYENFEILKKYQNKLPNLELVVIEVPFDILSRDKSYTSKIVDQENLIFYDVNTFGRPIKLQDHFLYFTDPPYFWERIKNYYLDKPVVQVNKYGFDTNQFYGSYQAKKNNDSLINHNDIFMENVQDHQTFKKNKQVLFQLISFCNKHHLEIMIYNPPNHYRYNDLKDPLIVKSRDQVLQEIQAKYPSIKILNEETNPEFSALYFYNANHLNPDGAKKATLILDDFINRNYKL